MAVTMDTTQEAKVWISPTMGPYTEQFVLIMDPTNHYLTEVRKIVTPS